MNRITDFVDSFVPKNIPKKKALILKAELTCHIIDKADFYKEIGYDDMESVNKAIEDFGTNESDKNFIFNEFEELYSEKSIFGILAFVIIAVMNYLCFPLDTWMYSADYNGDADPVGAFVSFTMIFIVLFLIMFARAKNYRKMLFFIGLSNFLIAASVLMCLYTQMAPAAIEENIIYLIDRFTPVSMGDVILGYYAGILSSYVSFGLPVIFALYCFISSYRLKRGSAKKINKPVLKISVFAGVYFVFALFSCILHETSNTYIDDYPRWFSEYDIYISEETDALYSVISTGDSLTGVTELLYNEGFTPMESYRNSLDKLTKKQFDNRMENFDFIDGFSIWFSPEKHIKGNGFIGIKAENGVITGKAVGNLNKNMYYGKYITFGYVDSSIRTDMDEMTEYFGSLKKGDREEDIMNRFGSEFGNIYTAVTSVENGVTETRYRIFCYGVSNPLAEDHIDKYDKRYIELVFHNGELSKGTSYDERRYDDNNSYVLTEQIKE